MNSPVNSVMARNRFEEILQFPHVAHNTFLTAGDKMDKNSTSSVDNE